MPSVGVGQRHALPPPVIHPGRPWVGGLGQERSTNVPEHPPEGPEPEFDKAGKAGWSGIRGRSRFIPPVRVAFVGHMETTYPGHFEVQPDPSAGRDNQSKAPMQPWTSEWDAVAKQYHPTGLGDDDLPLIRKGLLGYVNQVFDAVVSPGRRVPDLIRWADAGPVPRAFHRRIQLNRVMYGTEPAYFTDEHTDAQVRRGESPASLHTSKTPILPGSKARNRMTPGYVNRLTVRQAPRSYGSSTEVLGEGGSGAMQGRVSKRG